MPSGWLGQLERGTLILVGMGCLVVGVLAVFGTANGVGSAALVGLGGALFAAGINGRRLTGRRRGIRTFVEGE